MDFVKLGRSDIEVSRVCLGTMTWGEQNTEAEGFEQMDYALDRGINFFDVAEMYPIAPSKETQGETERIIGNWFESRKNRDKVVLATKVVGPGAGFDYIRDHTKRLTRADILGAVEGSLKRLKTDYIDLYQVHWPSRPAPRFGNLEFEYKDTPELGVPLEETLSALGEMVDQGKIRTIGLSNDTPWGTMKMLQLSDQLKLPRVVSVQNPYSLLNRSWELGMSEISQYEDVGLLAYSPIACGALSGKYEKGARPEGARMTIWPGRFNRYLIPEGIKAIDKYSALARAHGLEPADMANAFVYRQPFVASSIIGATKMSQLKSNIDAYDIELSAEIMEGIKAIHTEHFNPCG